MVWLDHSTNKSVKAWLWGTPSRNSFLVHQSGNVIQPCFGPKRSEETTNRNSWRGTSIFRKLRSTHGSSGSTTVPSSRITQPKHFHMNLDRVAMSYHAVESPTQTALHCNHATAQKRSEPTLRGKLERPADLRAFLFGEMDFRCCGGEAAVREKSDAEGSPNGGNKMEPLSTDGRVLCAAAVGPLPCLHSQKAGRFTTTCCLLPTLCPKWQKERDSFLFFSFFLSFCCVNYWRLQQVLILFLACICLTVCSGCAFVRSMLDRNDAPHPFALVFLSPFLFNPFTHRQ